MRRSAGLVLLLTSAACASEAPEPESGGTWVGTITTEGNVTTVINESGSVWGGDANLVEEVSIGVESGPQEYMFGRVMGLATSDEWMYVLDASIPVVRVYDRYGFHVMDIGRDGEGPGEFRNPNELEIGPNGRLFVRSVPRVVVFTSDGRPLHMWPQRGGVILPMKVGADGTLFTPTGFPKLGYQPIAPDGTKRPLLHEPEVASPTSRVIAGMGIMSLGDAFMPRGDWAIAPFRAFIVGVPTEYRFEIRQFDGTVIVVERSIDPVVVHGAEAAWYRRALGVLSRDPGLRAAGPPRQFPATKPWFEQIITDVDNRIWLRRMLESKDLGAGCVDRPVSVDEVLNKPCWRQVWGLDAFDDSGQFLGSVELPQEVRMSRPEPYIWGDQMLVAAEDTAGTIMVKRYRLVLPGER